MEHKLVRVYMLSIEEPDDYIYTLSGVVALWDNQQFNVFCLSSNHNRFRTALLRNSWKDLEDGVLFKETHFRLTDITSEMKEHGWTMVSAIPTILKHLYETNPLHLFFLQKHIEV